MANAIEKQVQAILAGAESKSKKMQALYGLGLEIKEIATLMGTRYNFVYNVISNQCNMNGEQIRTNKKEGASKKEQIIEMFVAGKSKKEIAIALKANATYVQNTVQEYKRAQEA